MTAFIYAGRSSGPLEDVLTSARPSSPRVIHAYHGCGPPLALFLGSGTGARPAMAALNGLAGISPGVPSAVPRPCAAVVIGLVNSKTGAELGQGPGALVVPGIGASRSGYPHHLYCLSAGIAAAPCGIAQQPAEHPAFSALHWGRTPAPRGIRRPGGGSAIEHHEARGSVTEDLMFLMKKRGTWRDHATELGPPTTDGQVQWPLLDGRADHWTRRRLIGRNSLALDT